MLDIRLLRENFETFEAGLARRGLGGVAHELQQLDSSARAAQTELQITLAERNDSSKLIGQAKAAKDDAKAQTLMTAVANLKERMPVLENAERQATAAFTNRLAEIPNIPADDVPDGKDEHDNVEVRRWGTPRSFDFTPLEHDTLGEKLGLDFDAAATMSGARFVVLRGQLARLERALGQFMLDTQTENNGYTEMNVPLLVRSEALFGTGQLPKFEDDQFKTTNEIPFYLIPTAEVSLTNTVREHILESEALPLRFTALTPCFRSEAGSAGRDTRGMIRQHQFNKVEMVSITTAEQSGAEHERMAGCAEALLQKLKLPYRMVVLCTGDMGFSAQKTYDIEVWLPGQARYREISSCSNCGDFQARRMNTRSRTKGEKATSFVHTLNGSGLAVGRTLIAVLENYQNADGSVTIPDVLLPYMAGLTQLEPKT